MRYYPVYLDLQQRTVLVVGGGAIAEGKALQLVDAGARVRVVSPSLTAKLSEMAERGMIDRREGRFTEADLNGVALVICATNEKEVNEEVSRLSAGRGLLCNVVDQPALCNFITPALVSRGELQISISTGGGSPSLTQRVKREIGELIGEEYGELLEVAAEMRRDAKQSIPDFEDRRKVLHAFVESDALDLIRAEQKEKARQIARELLEGGC
ncbi:MAG: bifunctional precorrin-2 dehydrogenase/sirohydrochlorin ferrochelatase [Acidobacteria bacterium]|nr:bifunctional precorrin-2 dehydrogenase/sirohydrochlorin ferrochelatase [Acidobacteriota bacterium]